MDEQDPTKARWYVAVDLAIKSISAIGLIVLGIAGWQLQSSAQKQQDALRIQDTSARLYLPPLQALAQIQIAFSLAAHQVDLSTANAGTQSNKFEWQLRYLLDSLHFPAGFDKAKASVTPLDAYGNNQKPRGSLTMPYKQTAALAAELNAALPLIRDMCHHSENNRVKYVKLLNQPPALYFAQDKNMALPGDQFIPIDATALDSWKSWFPIDGMSFSALCDTDFQPLFQELASGASDISAGIIELHHDLADRAVTIRVDAMKTQNELFGTSKQ
jgi:hypothetical protein